MNSSHKILPTNETNEKDNVVVDKNDLQIKPGNLARDKEHRSTTSLTNDRQSGIEDLEARIDLLLQAKNSRQRQTKVIQPNLKFRTPVNSNSNRNCCFYVRGIILLMSFD